MNTIEKAIIQINAGTFAGASSPPLGIDIRVQLITVLAYLITTLSIPVRDPASLIWLFVFPLVLSEASGIGYGRIFIKSLWILPLLIVMGIFNPILDTTPVWTIGTFTIDQGWLTFISLLLRGLLTFQGLLILVSTYGFIDICRCLQYFKLPKILVTQLLMLYRYIIVLLQEALTMHNARQSRGYGRKHYPLKMWGTFAGQLLIRSVQRANRVHAAMMSRGFSGIYYFKPFVRKLTVKDYAYLAVWLCIFAAIRFIDITSLMGNLFIHL